MQNLKGNKIIDEVLPDLNIVEDHGLQRSAEWFEKRCGKFTGSRIKELMSCNRSAAKLQWGRAEKIIHLGDAAKKYIFEKAMERKTGKVIKTPSTAPMKYGTENESAVIKLLDFAVGEVGFIEFIEGIAGASPDGLAEKNGKKIGVEIKCATGWGGYYDRITQPLDQSHVDFWQLTAEAMALNVDRIAYVVAEPSESIFEPNISNYTLLYFEVSQIHKKAIMDRCLLGDQIIKKHLSGVPFLEAVEEVCTNYEIN